jgi:hypothetical protein
MQKKLTEMSHLELTLYKIGAQTRQRRFGQGSKKWQREQRRIKKAEKVLSLLHT